MVGTRSRPLTFTNECQLFTIICLAASRILRNPIKGDVFEGGMRLIRLVLIGRQGVLNDWVIKDAACYWCRILATGKCDGAFFFAVVLRNVGADSLIVAVGMSGQQSKYEPRKGHCTDREYDVAGYSHPA